MRKGLWDRIINRSMLKVVCDILSKHSATESDYALQVDIDLF